MKDRFGREITYLRVSVTDLCNLRCRYCMPAEGVCKLSHEEMLTEEELLRAVRAAVSLGVNKIRLTGGEPLVKRNILSICRNTARIPGVREVCLTTNAVLLADRAEALRKAGVSRINISLDTLDAGKYKYITRGGNLSEALEGFFAALAAGFQKVKINSVLMKGFNEDEIRALAELSLQYPVDVRFIEQMPVGEYADISYAYLDGMHVLRLLPELEAVSAGEHTDSAGPAELYRFPGAKGNIGLIRPISCSFCGSCSRIRLTADGRLKPCLHSREEIRIKGLDFEQMREKFREAAAQKGAGHDLRPEGTGSCSQRSMSRIGG